MVEIVLCVKKNFAAGCSGLISWASNGELGLAREWVCRQRLGLDCAEKA